MAQMIRGVPALYPHYMRNLRLKFRFLRTLNHRVTEAQRTPRTRQQRVFPASVSPCLCGEFIAFGPDFLPQMTQMNADKGIYSTRFVAAQSACYPWSKMFGLGFGCGGAGAGRLRIGYPERTSVLIGAEIVLVPRSSFSFLAPSLTKEKVYEERERLGARCSKPDLRQTVRRHCVKARARPRRVLPWGATPRL